MKLILVSWKNRLRNWLIYLILIKAFDTLKFHFLKDQWLELLSHFPVAAVLITKNGIIRNQLCVVYRSLLSSWQIHNNDMNLRYFTNGICFLIISYTYLIKNGNRVQKLAIFFLLFSPNFKCYSLWSWCTVLNCTLFLYFYCLAMRLNVQFKGSLDIICKIRRLKPSKIRYLKI